MKESSPIQQNLGDDSDFSNAVVGDQWELTKEDPMQLSLNIIEISFAGVKRMSLLGTVGYARRRRRHELRDFSERHWTSSFKEVAHPLINVGNRDNHGTISAMIRSGPTMSLGYNHH